MTKQAWCEAGLMARTTIGLLSAARRPVHTHRLESREATPMPRSPRRGRPQAATRVRSAPRDVGVYPAGEGFGQNFPGGKIFTPATEPTS